MGFSITYHQEAVEDINKLNQAIKKRIIKAIENRLVEAPESYGKPLRYSLKGLWSLRVGDYRVVYSIRGEEILILRVGHRREVYED